MPHLRKGADWSLYLAEKALGAINNNETEFSFKMYEPSRYYLRIGYPADWNTLTGNRREEIAEDIAIRLGQYLSFVGCTWHEIVTYFGYRAVGWYPEFASAFSWEDCYSNLLGVYIAGTAMRDSQRDYDEAMTVGIDSELQRLGPRSKKTAMKASESMRGKWFSGDMLFMVDMKGRNLDIGLDDGYITPWLVPSVAECPAAEPLAYPVPTLTFLAEYGFSVKLEIEPREFEKGRILKVVFPDPQMRGKRIEPSIHFATLMEHIRRDTEKRYGRNVAPNQAKARRIFQNEQTQPLTAE